MRMYHLWCRRCQHGQLRMHQLARWLVASPVQICRLYSCMHLHMNILHTLILHLTPPLVLRVIWVDSGKRHLAFQTKITLVKVFSFTSSSNPPKTNALPSVTVCAALKNWVVGMSASLLHLEPWFWPNEQVRSLTGRYPPGERLKHWLLVTFLLVSPPHNMSLEDDKKGVKASTYLPST